VTSASSAADERIPSGDPGRDRFVERLSAQIFAFEIAVDRWEAKAKLSQNRAPDDQRRVLAALEASDDPLDRATALAMREIAGISGSPGEPDEPGGDR
jgi:predicted FMN-binding regulatory protein PaiB